MYLYIGRFLGLQRNSLYVSTGQAERNGDGITTFVYSESHSLTLHDHDTIGAAAHIASGSVRHSHYFEAHGIEIGLFLFAHLVDMSVQNDDVRLEFVFVSHTSKYHYS